MDVIDVAFISFVTIVGGSLLLNVYLIWALREEAKYSAGLKAKLQKCIDEMHLNPFNYSK